MYTIVLVCVGNFQPYIITNLEFLIRLQHKHIVVITEKRFFPLFQANLDEYKDQFRNIVKLVDVSLLPDYFQYMKNTRLDSVFRDGFWVYTSARIYYVHAFMKMYNVQEVIHIENDVMLFYHVDLLKPYLTDIGAKSIFIPFDCYKRNIASIVYIPNHSILETVLSSFSLQKNDMENFVLVANKYPGLIDSFPISVLGLETGNPEMDFVCKNYHKFGGYIFDAAAIGQYLGGVDPRNIPGDSVGFVNETCVVKYNYYHFNWKLIDGVFRPFMIISNPNVCDSGQLEVPIFNLHIHCKDLNSFML